MLHFINRAHLFDSHTETHYRFHTQIDSAQYPQVHDFYEIVLVTAGVLHLKLCGQHFSLQAGNLVLIRPGDIHSKAGTDCAHINLAFPTEAVDALFAYLCDEACRKLLTELPVLAPTCLSAQAVVLLQEKMQFLNTIPAAERYKTRTILRCILFEVVTQSIFPMLFSAPAHKDLPIQLADSLTVWQSVEHRQEGLDFFCRYTGYSKEHLCRLFKRHLGVTPSVYLNQQRLNYAVNLLLHSDYSVTDIIYEAGFKSASCFYHVFRAAYELSPKQFCAQHCNWDQKPISAPPSTGKQTPVI